LTEWSHQGHHFERIGDWQSLWTTNTNTASHFPSTTMSMEESISLEETNKIRISLGLKPLTDDKAPADDKDKQAEENYAKRRDQDAKERESK
jgi:HIND motif